VWVASSFCLESISSSSPIPVVKIPPGFDFRVPGRRTRESFGIERDDLVFLYVFDGASSFHRKNPGGIVSAFRRAFPRPGRERLILKTVNAPQSKLEALVRLARGSRVEIVADYMNREELLDLLAAADCYVSLHRSEGFGLTILESMAFGKPVIATDYSGNEDFLHRGNGFPVGYRLVPIRRSVGAYAKGNVWAEPDLDQAAGFMRRVSEEPEEAQRVAEAARTEVGERWAVSHASRQICSRLELLRRLDGAETRVVSR
ncbi:MAG: glycosyltransferase family 4 protein, partial [Vicinamibacteria bacterium]